MFCMHSLYYIIYQYLCSITLCSMFWVIIKIGVTNCCYFMSPLILYLKVETLTKLGNRFAATNLGNNLAQNKLTNSYSLFRFWFCSRYVLLSNNPVDTIISRTTAQNVMIVSLFRTLFSDFYVIITKEHNKLTMYGSTVYST